MLWCLAAGGLVVGLLSSATATLGFSIDNEMDRIGVTTNASVTDVHGDLVTVLFETEGGTLLKSELNWWPAEPPEVDAVVDITYNPRDPAYVVRAGSDEDQYFATLFAAVGAYALAVGVGTFVGAILIHRARAARRAWPGTRWGAAG